jgi:uncharacterized membrane protein (UPF0127 family)
MKIFKAQHWWQRAGGLLIRPKLMVNEVLWLQPCWSVHTFCMRYPIAVFFLDDSHTVIQVQPYLPPNRIAFCLGAQSVCEMLPVRVDHCEAISVSLMRSLSLNTAA